MAVIAFGVGTFAITFGVINGNYNAEAAGYKNYSYAHVPQAHSQIYILYISWQNLYRLSYSG